MATSTRSRYFRLLFAVALIFALMTPLTAAAQDPPDWSFRTETPHDVWSEGGSWAIGTEILVAVNDPVSGPKFTGTATVEQTGPNPEDVGWWLNTGDFDIEPGDLVTVDDGVDVKDLIVLDLTIDTVDADLETISGTAPADTTFPVHASDGVSDASRTVTSDGGGAWSADFSTGDTFDIAPGTGGSAAIFDAENDATQRSWNIPVPTIEAQPLNDIVQGQRLGIGVGVSVEIDDPANGVGVDWSDSGTTVPTPWDPSSGYVEFDPGTTGFAVSAGQAITLSDGVTTKVLVVAPLTITDVDIAGDLVHGTASNDADLNIWADSQGSSSNRVVTAAPDGSWTADFSIAWEGWDPLDLQEGSQIDVWEGDEDGDTTRTWSYVPNPQFSVETPNQVWSHGDGWIAGRTVTIAVNDGVSDVYSTTAEVIASGPNPWEVGWSTDTGAFDILPGHDVTIDDGVDIVRTLEVVGLDVTDVNEGGDTITGAAPANAWVDANANDGVSEANRRVQASGAGTFTVDFGTPGVEDWEQDTLDLGAGVGGSVQVFEDDGDSTHRGWRVADPRFGVDVIHEEMWANDWPTGATLNFQVFEPTDLVNPVWDDSMTVVDTPWGQTEAGYRFWGDFDVHGGQLITMTDGSMTRELLVSTLVVTNVDPDTDTYTGTVEDVDYDKTHEVCAWARDLIDGQQGVELCTIPSVEGDWTIDFTGVGEIIPGDHTGAYQNDPDGDQTSYAWFVPPWIYVEIGDDTNPDFPDRVHLDQWVFPVELTNGTDTVTVFDTDGDTWEVVDFDVTPGETVTATGNDGRTKNVYLEELSVDTVTLWDEDPPSTVYGSTTVTYEGNVQVTASADYGWWTERWVDATAGAYEADFANPGNGWREQELGYFGQGGGDDVYSGGEIRAHIYDGDNDQVQAIWHATNPRIIIVRGNDRIEAVDFPKGEPLTIELDDPAFDGVEFSETGIPAANPDKPWETLLVVELGDYTVPDVATVTALDATGTPVVTTEVIPFSISFVDPDADTITGMAAEGSEVFVQADGNWRYPIADDTNTWVADFSQPGTQPGEENPVDIGPGSSGGATLIAAGGSATTVLWSISNAQFWVDPDGEYVWGTEFAPNASVTITIEGAGYGDFPTDNGGNFDTSFDQATVDIAEGSVIIVTDGDVDKTHTVTALAISGVDQDLDQVSGLAAAGTDVNVWDNETGASRDVTATDGTWLADFAGDADLGPGSNGGAQQCDDDGDCTQLGWQLTNPAVNVDPHHDGVSGNQWEPDSAVEIFIDSAYHSTLSTNEWGDFGDTWDPMGVDITEDTTVEVSQGDVTKTHEVTSLAITGIDVDTEIMTGTADGPFDVWVHDSEAWRHLEHTGGAWSVDWSVPAFDEAGNGTADLEPGSNGNSNECDDDGDCTWADWNVARPIFRVDPLNGGIWGHEWYDVAEVTVTVGGVELDPLPVDGNGDWGTDVDPAELAEGTVVEVSGGGVIKTLTITGLTVTLVDEAEDAVLGTADPGSSVQVEIHDVEEGVWRSVFADAGSGEWTADFTDPVSEEDGQGTMDFEPGIHGAAYQEDADGDTTWIDWQVREPRIEVEPRSESLWGNEFMPNSSVDITINGEDYGNLPTDEAGNWGEGWEPGDLDLQADDEIVVTDGVTTKTHIVTPLAITSIDIGTNIMMGTALPDHGFSIWVHDSEAYEWVVADGTGDWTVDWTAQVDLGPGSNGNSYECDDDGDCTWAGWEVPNPQFSVETPFYAWSHGDGWVEGRTVTLIVDSDDDPTNGLLYMADTLVERWGPEPWEVGWNFELEGEFEIAPDDFVSVFDGVDIAKSLWVVEIEVTDIDEDGDSISGTAPPLSRVEVNAGNEDYEAYRSVEADADGVWFADFANPGDEEHEQDTFDITIGTGGAAQVFDDDGDSTHRGWQPAADSATVEGHVYLDGDPLSDVEVWSSSDAVFTCTDSEGYFVFEDLSPVGDALVATGPSYSDAGCGNTAFVDPDGMPLLVAAQGELDLTDGYEYLEFNVENAAAIQYVRVEDVTGGSATPVNDVVIHAVDRNDEEFVAVFGHDPDPADYQAILDTGIGEIAWIDWTGAALEHEDGLAEVRYPYISDVLVLAELDPIQGAQSNADEFAENTDGIVEGPEILFQIGEAGPVVTVDDIVMDEGDRTGRVFVKFHLSEALATPVTVTWATEDGTAIAGEDYKAASKTFTFRPGRTTVTMRIQVIGDTVVEEDEDFSIVFDVDGAAAGDPGIVTLLNDDEEQPDLPELSVDDTEVLEGNRRDTRAGVTFTLSEPAPQAVTFTFSTVDGSAVAGDDYYGTNRTIAVGAGATSVTVYLRIIADTIPEPDELFTVEVSNVTGATIGDGVGEVIILNDD